MSKIRELLEIINRQNMVPSDSRYFDYERKLLNVIHAAVPELRALLAERDALREQQHKLEVHEKDCPVFRDFFHKHAIGEMINPSCLVCGQETKRSEAAITHSELADIIVCVRCRDAVLRRDGEP